MSTLAGPLGHYLLLSQDNVIWAGLTSQWRAAKESNARVTRGGSYAAVNFEAVGKLRCTPLRPAMLWYDLSINPCRK